MGGNEHMLEPTTEEEKQAQRRHKEFKWVSQYDRDKSLAESRGKRKPDPGRTLW